jgi:hypothetical protein
MFELKILIGKCEFIRLIYILKQKTYIIEEEGKTNINVSFDKRKKEKEEK